MTTNTYKAINSSGGGAVDSVNGQIGTVVLTKSDIGLGNVDNTSDANKPVSTATQTALDLKINSTEKGANNGVATLGAGGKIPAAQLPNTVMDYLGAWNASTNSPALIDGTGNAGDVYRVSVAGSQDLGSGVQNFDVGDFVIYSGAIWQWSGGSDAVVSVNGQQGIVLLDTDDIAEGTALYFTDERSQDAIGSILVDSATIDLTYSDATPSITAAVINGSIGDTQLGTGINANKIADGTVSSVEFQYINSLSSNAQTQLDGKALSSVTLSGAANGGITSVIGDLSASRSISIDITNATAETTSDNADSILIYDNSATALRKMTRGNFLSGVPTTSAGDINESSFSAANDQSVAANITGLSFASGTVRSFSALVSVNIDATSDLFESFELLGINKGSGFDMSVTRVGDDSGVDFSITSAGAVQYVSTNISGFVSNTVKFRAITTSV